MDQVKPYLENAGCETLAVFDIDLVLLQPSDPAFQMPNVKRYREAIGRVAKSLKEGKKEILLTLIALSTESILIDKQTPQLIKKLRDKGVPTIALTANLTGGLADVTSLESWKIERLKSVGIDFTKSAPYDDEIAFCDLPAYRGNHSVYTKGILFANGPTTTKGEVLTRFLQMSQLSFKRIVFIDDRELNLKSVGSALQKHYPEIQYEGIHYLDAGNYPSQSISEKEFEARWRAFAEQANTLD